LNASYAKAFRNAFVYLLWDEQQEDDHVTASATIEKLLTTFPRSCFGVVFVALAVVLVVHR